MPTTFQSAIDELFTIVKAIFDDSTWTAAFGYQPVLYYPGDPQAQKPDMTRLWARVSCKIVTDEQYSLANTNGEQLYEAVGLLFVQLFCPRNQPGSIDNGRRLGVALQRAFYPQSPSGEIWFRRAAVRELDETPDNYPINVVVEYRYRTTKSGATNEASYAIPVHNPAVRVITFTGAVNGINTVFVISSVPDTLIVFSNGILRSEGVGNDYVLSGNTITMAVAPNSLSIFGA